MQNPATKQNRVVLRSHETEKRTVAVQYRPESLNREARTIDFVLATDTPAEFGGYREILGMKAGELIATRLDAGIVPVLDSHPQAQFKVQTIDDQFGVIIAWRIEDGELIGTLKFATDERSDRAFTKVAEGIVRTGSIGYFVYAHVDVSLPEDSKKTYRAVKWEIVEFSLVSIPRDPNAQSRSHNFEKIQTEILNANLSHERDSSMENPVIPATVTNEAEIARAKAAAEDNTVERVLDIQAAVRAAGLDTTVADDLIKRKLSMADASKEIFKKLEETRTQTPAITPQIDINHVEETVKREARIEGLALAIEHRLDPSTKLADNARSFANLRMLDMAKESLRLQGVDVRRLDQETVIRQAFQGTSEFPVATQQALSKKVKKGYDYASTNYLPLITETSRPDFKASASVSLSDAPALEKMGESGEFKTGKFSESAEIYKVETYGKRIALTRQALINDDLSLFDKIPFSMGVAGARLVHKLVWDIIKTNAKMSSDNVALFHTASHKNLDGTAKATVQAVVAALLKLMRDQTSPANNIMNYNPGYVSVGSDLEIEARQLIAAITATKSSDVNIFANTLQGVIVEASLPAKTVILSGRKEEVDLIEVAWLNGNKGVNVRQRENSNILGVEWDVFMDVGAAPNDYRGFYKGSVT